MRKIKLAELPLDATFQTKIDSEVYTIFKICGSVILSKFDGKTFCFSYNKMVIVND